MCEIEGEGVVMHCSGVFSLPEVIADEGEGGLGECAVGDAGGDVVCFCTRSSGSGVAIVTAESFMSLVTKTKSYSDCD